MPPRITWEANDSTVSLPRMPLISMWVWDGAQEHALLSSPVRPMLLLVQAPRFGNH